MHHFKKYLKYDFITVLADTNIKTMYNQLKIQHCSISYFVDTYFCVLFSKNCSCSKLKLAQIYKMRMQGNCL